MESKRNLLTKKLLLCLKPPLNAQGAAEGAGSMVGDWGGPCPGHTLLHPLGQQQWGHPMEHCRKESISVHRDPISGLITSHGVHARQLVVTDATLSVCCQPSFFTLSSKTFGFGGSRNLGHSFSPTMTSVNFLVPSHCLAQ